MNDVKEWMDVFTLSYILAQKQHCSLKLHAWVLLNIISGTFCGTKPTNTPTDGTHHAFYWFIGQTGNTTHWLLGHLDLCSLTQFSLLASSHPVCNLPWSFVWRGQCRYFPLLELRPVLILSRRKIQVAFMGSGVPFLLFLTNTPILSIPENTKTCKKLSSCFPDSKTSNPKRNERAHKSFKKS